MASTKQARRHRPTPSAPQSQMLDPDRYNHIVKQAELEGVQLISCDFSIVPDFFVHRHELKFNMKHEELAASFYDDGEPSTTAIFRFVTKATHGRKRVLAIQADFMVAYGVPKDADELHAKAFATGVGRVTAYPYFRALVAHLSSLGNAELPPLPLISRAPLRRQREMTDGEDLPNK